MKWQDELKNIPTLTSINNDVQHFGEVLEITDEDAKELKGSLNSVLKARGLESGVIVGQLSSDDSTVRLVIRTKKSIETKPSMEPPKESIWPMEPLNE